MNGLNWCLLARATANFLSAARQAHFCEDLLDEIERRLFEQSPFPAHHK